MPVRHYRRSAVWAAIVVQLTVTLALLAQQAAVDVVTSSEYVRARDGTRIAVDVHLPKGAQERLPALIEYTRYWRASENATTGVRNPSLNALDRFFITNGYAVVKVDARGSGASFGTRPVEYGPDEVRDGYAVVDWIVRQAWSSGSVGAYGTSYSGTTAELLAAVEHPAVKAVVPGWADFDAYTSPIRPYGLLTAFAEEWGNFVAALDRNDRSAMRAAVRRVDADTSGALVAAAVAEHAKNPNVATWAKQVEYRDDRYAGGPSYHDIGPVRWKKEIERSNVPMLVLVSWLDAGTTEGALDRFRSFRNPQKLVIMASSHGGGAHASPFVVDTTVVRGNPTQDEMAQMRLQFFDRYLKGVKNGVESWPNVRYYTLGLETYQESSTWPLPGTTVRHMYLDAENVLSSSAPKGDGSDRYVVDFGVNTGPSNRWATQMGRPVLRLSDRGAMDARMLTYTTAPFETDMHIAGSPTIDMHVSSTHTDGAVIVYLEDVDATGRSRYITEGGLRLIHRKLSRDTSFGIEPYVSFERRDAAPMKPGEPARVHFRILPTSVVIKAGHRLRLAIAGADSGVLGRAPENGTPTLTIHRGPRYQAVLALPVVPLHKP
jgi:putative CocE/NonD family hydrolase